MATIPPALLDAIKEQRAVLFLGAGASINAKHPHGEKIPTGDVLRDLICDKFLGGKLKGKSLVSISAIAANETGLSAFQAYIHDLFEAFQPAEFHHLIPQFRWRAIATTNFDLIVERAYSNVSRRCQNLVKTVKDGDHFDTRLNKENDPVGFYKLHGCIEYYSDLTIPLVLGNEQYASYETNRMRFYARFKDLGYEYPIIFAGYSISDPHIQRILFDLTDPNIGRPPYYFISPGIENIESRYWSTHRVFAVDYTFEEFLRQIDKALPPLSRAIPVGIGGGELSIRKHYRVANASEPAFLASYLTTDVLHVNSGLSATRQIPSDFYRGYDNGWGCIIHNLDVRRSFSDSVLVDAVLSEETKQLTSELFMLKGPAGNGKSVALKRIAWETATNYDKLTLYAEGPAALRIEPIAEIYRLTGQRIFLFVDHVALVRNELENLLNSARHQSTPLSVIGAERDSEWNIYCEQLEPFLRQEFPVNYLYEQEIKDLIGLLERHKALGALKDLSAEKRIYAFTESAERQLLVALHEATSGLPFEEIIADEYERIEPPIARSLYLDICALHQFGAPVRAGLISRASGIEFAEFQERFFKPLENVVHVVADRHRNDVFYRSRHQRVAEIVFNRALPTPEDKFDLLARLLKSMNIDYSSDEETFSRLIRGRRIADIFPNVDLGRLFYETVEGATQSKAFVLHQRAVFEMAHPNGSLELAEQSAANAYQLNPRSRSIQHTQAEVARRLANVASDPLRKRALRRTTREKLGQSRISEYDAYTRALLAIDEFKDLSVALETFDSKVAPPELIEAAKEAELAIQSGIQHFPESAQLLAAEATLRDFLEQSSRALLALERAFRLNPRQDWLAVRLARKYKSLGDFSKSKRTLETCLEKNPTSKLAHLELGRILIDMGDKNNVALQHLRRGFTEGDSNYEAQFWYARQLFLNGQCEEAEKAFGKLHEKSPGSFRTKASASVEEHGKLIIYDGRIIRREEGYVFIKIPAFNSNIYGSRHESDPIEWQKLLEGSNIQCSLAFTRKGIRCVSIKIH